MKTFDVTDLEEAAAESEQDRRDHAKLKTLLGELLEHEDLTRVPYAVKRLVDAGVDPMVVAKVLLIGDRDAGARFLLANRSMALAQDELVAATWISLAIRDVDVDLAATMMISGATWLSTQFGIERELLAELVTDSARRPRHPERHGYGVVDLVDSHGVGQRADIVTAIRLCKLPSFAPLEYSPS